MANGQLQGVLRHIRKLVAAEYSGAQPDRELLDRFVRQRDEAAFAALVHRHGAMVFAVCRRVLHHAHDAEDACQAAFLVLARKAGSIRKKDSLASWLHGVAYRAASNLKRGILRRQARETIAAAEGCRTETADVSWREVKALVDEELRRLPESYQAPLILCYLKGKTRDEAARLLGWSAGTVKARLERGRDMLRARLTRRGLNLSAVLLAGLLAEEAGTAALPALQVVSIVKAGLLLASGQAPAAGLVSVRATVLMEGVLRAMFATKLKIISAVFLAASLVGLGFFLQAGATLSADQANGDDDPQVASSGLREAAEPVAAKSAVDAALLARHKTQSQNNLKELALAMHNYLDTHQHFPPPATYAGRMMGPGMPGMARGGMMPPGFPSGPGAMKPGLQPPGGPGPGGSQPGGFRPKTTPPGGGATPKPQPSAGGGLPGGGGPAAPGSAQPPGGAPGAGGPVPGGDTPQPPGASGFPGGPGGSGGGPPRFPGPVMGPRGGGATSGGQALLSWRVALLPYLGENDLYKQFRLNEPWDSAHNLKLLKKMPKVFAPPGIKTQTPYSTFYQVFVGPHAAFEKHRGVRIFEFTDGTSNTILIIEAGFPVPWTKPADLHYAADEPLPELGGIFTDVMHAAFADGSVHTLSRKCDQDMLRRAIVRDDGNVVDWSKLHRSVNRSVSGLQTEKLQLTEELRAERDRLEALRREVAELKSRADAAGTEALRRENEHLQQLLFETRREAQRLRDEIERLKKALPPK